MNILVTGGLGFLGTTLTRQLLDEGRQVWVLDNLSSAVVSPSHFAADSGFHFIHADIVGYQALEADFEQVFHLAGPVGSVGILNRPGSVGKEILDGTAAVLDVSVMHRSRLIFVSTSEVYGQAGAFPEEATCQVSTENSIRAEYGLGKRLAEMMVHNRMAGHLPFNIIRPYNIAGPYQSASSGFVIPTFLRQALEGRPLTVFGDGTQTRAFGHVEDICNGIRLAASGPQGQTYNLGNPGNLVSMLDLAKRILTLTGSHSEIRLVDPCQIHGPRYRESFEKLPEPGKALRELGWLPQRNLDEVLAGTLAVMQEQLV